MVRGARRRDESSILVRLEDAHPRVFRKLIHPPANFKNPKFCRGYRVSYRLKLPRSPATTFVWTLEVCIWELAWVSEIWWALLIYRGSGNLAKIYGKAVWASEYFCIYKKNMSWWHEKMFVTNPLGIMKTLRKQNQFQRVIPTTLPTYLEKKTVFRRNFEDFKPGVWKGTDYTGKGCSAGRDLKFRANIFCRIFFHSNLFPLKKL